MTDYTVAKNNVVITFPFKFNSLITKNDWFLIRFLLFYLFYIKYFFMLT